MNQYLIRCAVAVSIGATAISCTSSTRGGAYHPPDAPELRIEGRGLEEAWWEHIATPVADSPQTWVAPGDLLFETNSSTLTPEATERIQALAPEITHASRVEVVGHCDSRGDETWLNQLSTDRAQAVADVLLASGMPPDHVHVRGAGASEPVADESGPDPQTAMARNRRVEITISDD